MLYKEGRQIVNFSKWFIVSFILGIIGLPAVFFAENIARVSGELNLSLLLGTIIIIFIINIVSLLSLVKANANRIKREMVLSVFVAAIPLLALAMNGFIFTVYFGGK